MDKQVYEARLKEHVRFTLIRIAKEDLTSRAALKAAGCRWNPQTYQWWIEGYRPELPGAKLGVVQLTNLEAADLFGSAQHRSLSAEISQGRWAQTPIASLAREFAPVNAVTFNPEESISGDRVIGIHQGSRQPQSPKGGKSRFATYKRIYRSDPSLRVARFRSQAY